MLSAEKEAILWHGLFQSTLPVGGSTYQQYSYSAPPMEQVETYIETTGDSEFLKAVDGRKADKVWKLIDELVEAVKILHPRMYTTFIDKVQDL